MTQGTIELRSLLGKDTQQKVPGKHLLGFARALHLMCVQYRLGPIEITARDDEDNAWVWRPTQPQMIASLAGVDPWLGVVQ